MPVPIGTPLWALLMMVYFILCATYTVSIRRGAQDLLSPLQMMSQGLIISTVSLELGSIPMVSWTGVLITISGSIMLLQHFMRQRKTTSLNVAAMTFPERSALSPLQGNLPFPTLAVDKQGRILDANPAFFSLVSGKNAVGAPVTDFFIPGETHAKFPGGQFSIHQKQKDDLFFFSFMDLNQSQKMDAPAQLSVISLIDEKTGIYSKQYADLRIPEELSRASRYRRWLCGILLKVEYTYIPGLDHQEDKEDVFFTAYCHYVRVTIRDSDMCFHFGDRKILVLLPDTPQQGAKDVSLKLTDLQENLTELIQPSSFSVDIDYGFLYYSGNYQLSYHQFLEKLHSALEGTAESIEK